MDTFAQIPAAGLSRIHMDPEPPLLGLGHHRLLAELSDDAIDAFVDVAGPDSGSPLLLAELRQLGGALGRPSANGGALSSLEAAFGMFGIGMPMTPEMGQAIVGHLDKLHDTMEPWAAAVGYFNFAERPSDVDAIFPQRPARASPRSSGAGTPTTGFRRTTRCRWRLPDGPRAPQAAG